MAQRDSQQDQPTEREEKDSSERICISLPSTLEEKSMEVGKSEYGGRSQYIQDLLREDVYARERGGSGGNTVSPVDAEIIGLEEKLSEHMSATKNLEDEVAKISSMVESIASDRGLVEDEELIASKIRGALREDGEMTTPAIADKLDMDVEKCQEGIDYLREKFDVVNSSESDRETTEWELIE